MNNFLKHPFTNTFVGNGILAGALVWLTLYWNGMEKARDHEQEIRNRRRDLVAKVMHNGASSISVLKSYRDIDLWLKKVKEGSSEKLHGLDRDKVMASSMELYKLYVQQPKLESVAKEIEITFKGHDAIKDKAKRLADLVKQIEECPDAGQLDKLTQRFETDLAVLVDAMEAEINTYKE
jgi:hypothetical protein